jgi:hypothetical protein
MLISSTTTLTETTRIIFDQISWYPVAYSRCHVKFTIRPRHKPHSQCSFTKTKHQNSIIPCHLPSGISIFVDFHSPGEIFSMWRGSYGVCDLLTTITWDIVQRYWFWNTTGQWGGGAEWHMPKTDCRVIFVVSKDSWRRSLWPYLHPIVIPGY